MSTLYTLPRRSVFTALAGLMLAFFTCVSAQTFTTGRVDYGDGTSNVFSVAKIAPDGKFYVFWKDGATYSTGTMPRYKLIRWESGTSAWAGIGTILASPSTFPGIITEIYQVLGDRFDMEIDANGHFHVALVVYSMTHNTIYYGNSPDGETWTFTIVEAVISGTSVSTPHLELDPDQRPHIVYRYYNSAPEAASRPYELRHFSFNGTSWSGGAIVSRLGTTNEIKTDFDYAIDSLGHGHLAFGVEPNASQVDLHYATDSSGSWVETKLAASSGGVNAYLQTSLVVDGDNKAHVVRHDGGYGIYYHTNRTGTWTSTRINGNLQGAVEQHSLSINGNGDLVLLYNQRSAVNSGAVRYAALFSGESTWLTGDVFSGNSYTANYFASAVSDDGVAMFTFDHYTGASSPSNSDSNRYRELEYAVGTIGPPVPTVTSPTSASVAATTAVLGGNVTSDSGSAVTARGVVVAPTASNANPTLGGTGVLTFPTTGTTGVFTVNVSGLNGGTAYSYKAYATNANGTGYSSVGTFTTQADAIPPTIQSIVRLTPADQSITAGPVTFRVTYSEAVQGVTTAQFAFENVSGNIAGSVADVSGTGDTRDVTVSITSGSGAFRLEPVN